MNNMGRKMQKEQNVNNKLFFLLLIFPFLLLGQNIKEGEYYVKNWDLLNEHWANFSFHQNNIFEYANGSDIGISKYGKGHYTLTKDSLFLNFDLTEIKYDGYHIIKPYINDKDSVTIDVITYDLKKNKPLPNTQVFIPKAKFITTFTDTNGKARLVVPKGENVWLEIINDDTLQAIYDIELSLHQNYEIEIFLNNKVWGKFIKNDIWKYKIKKLKKDYIELQSKNGSLLKLEKAKIKDEDNPFEQERN